MSTSVRCPRTSRRAVGRSSTASTAVHHDRALIAERLRPTVEAMADLLVEGADGEHGRVANFTAHLIMTAESMWTFLDADCDATNNMAESSLRKP